MEHESILARYSSVNKNVPSSQHNGDFEIITSNPDHARGSLVGISLESATVPNARSNVWKETSFLYEIANGATHTRPGGYSFNFDYTFEFQVETGDNTNVYVPFDVMWAITGPVYQTCQAWTSTLLEVIEDALLAQGHGVWQRQVFYNVLDPDNIPYVTKLILRLDYTGGGTRRLRWPTANTTLERLLHIETPIPANTWTTSLLPFAREAIIPAGQYDQTSLLTELNTSWDPLYEMTLSVISDTDSRYQLESALPMCIYPTSTLSDKSIGISDKAVCDNTLGATTLVGVNELMEFLVETAVGSGVYNPESVLVTAAPPVDSNRNTLITYAGDVLLQAIQLLTLPGGSSAPISVGVLNSSLPSNYTASITWDGNAIPKIKLPLTASFLSDELKFSLDANGYLSFELSTYYGYWQPMTTAITEMPYVQDISGDQTIHIMCSVATNRRCMDPVHGYVKELGVVGTGEYLTYTTTHFSNASQAPFLVLSNDDSIQTIGFQLQDEYGTVINPGAAHSEYLLRFFYVH